MTREEWLAERRKSIGGSDAPCLFGQGWRTPYEVWADKLGLLPELDETPMMRLGRELEPLVKHDYCKASGHDLKGWPPYFLERAPDCDYRHATPDDVTLEDDEQLSAVLECKVVSPYQANKWAAGPPLGPQIQLQHNMDVLGYKYGVIAWMVLGEETQYREYELHDAFVAELRRREAAFWALVESRTEPPVDGAEGTARALAMLHPADDGDAIALSGEFSLIDDRLVEMKAKHKELGDLIRESENKIKAAIGDATYGVLPDGTRYSWKLQQRKGYTVEPSECRVLRRIKA